MAHLMSAIRRAANVLATDERGEINVSMISWMVVAALVVFAFRTQLTNMLSSAVSFVQTTLGI